MKKLNLILIFIFLTPLLSFGKQFSGYTEPFQTINASFGDNGTISKINVKEGDIVKQGDVLATLNNNVFEIELKIAEENVKVQQKRFDKLKSLVDKGLATNDEFDKATSELEINKLQADRIRALIEKRTIKSPVNGVVTNILKNLSEAVSDTESALTVVQIDQLIINLYVDFEDSKVFTLNQILPISFGSEAEIAQGNVVFVSPDTDKASRTIRIKLLIDNPSIKYSSGILGVITI